MKEPQLFIYFCGRKMNGSAVTFLCSTIHIPCAATTILRTLLSSTAVCRIGVEMDRSTI